MDGISRVSITRNSTAILIEYKRRVDEDDELMCYKS